MKSIEIQVEKTETIYICEVCGDESSYYHVIVNCEETHKQEEEIKNCVHEYVYEIEHDYDGGMDDILKTCKKCSFHKEHSLDLDDLPQDILELLFNTSEGL